MASTTPSIGSAPSPSSSSSNCPHVGKTLELKSPFGEDSMTYKWPLKKGKGSVRRSEDKEDEAAEILETIRWVCADHPEIDDNLNKNGAFGHYDPSSFEAMESLCIAYNKSIEKYLINKKKGTAKINENFKERCTRPHLKHILQKCYNKSVADPNLLNHYEAFTPEVYGETSFELICQILDKLHPISSDNKFVDLGSGVGQVVLQVAALTDCEVSFGIEKANTPANYARELERWFKFWMKFYGKTFSNFRLAHGDFLDQSHRADILQSTIVFVNNFAFGPEVDQHLKDIFADLNDGARIFSSKSFCALNFRITDRNLTDIGTIMHVSRMDPLKGSVSWTGRPVSYYLHVIDRARLERYFQKKSASNQEESRRRGGRNHRGNGDLEGSSLEASMDTSRASSVEHEVGGLSLTDKKAFSEDEDIFDDLKATTKPRRGRKGKVNKNKLNTAVLRLSKQNSLEDSSANEIPNATTTDSNSSTPPLPSPSSATSSGIVSETTSNSSSRPVRTAAATANAISEAQSEIKSGLKMNKSASSGMTGSSSGSSGMIPAGRKKKNAQIAARISGLDLLHDTTMSNIDDSNKDVSAPTGCVNERLNKDHPRQLVHEELTTSLVAGEDGKPIPFQLQVYLDKVKKQYLSFMRHIQDPVYKEKIKADIEVEKKKKAELQKREKQLKAQIDNLISDSLNLLKTRLSELGIQAKTPPEFIEKAKGIVCQHHELQRNKAAMENEVRQLELEQEKMIQAKEKEMLDHLLKQGLSMSEARRRIKITIENTINDLQGSDNKVSPLLNKLADVTLTRCEQLPSSTQIRKRPVVTKQRDWPEKKIIKDEMPPAASAVANWSPEMAKIEERNPEMLAKKIIAQGRSLESKSKILSPRSSKDSQAPVVCAPTSSSAPMPSAPPPSAPLPAVEVRRIESNNKHDYPRLDLSSTLNNVQSQRDNGGNEPLVLPAHPRSRSSDQTEDIPTYHTNKMSSAPRAPQFEDRLKTIIHSVLSGEDKERQAQLQQQQQQKPMFSPIKKELPTHLPPPPSGINFDKFKRSMAATSSSPSSVSVSLPQMGSARTMNEIIEKEMERNLEQQRRVGPVPPGPPGPISSPLSPQKLVRTPTSSAALTMSRMSQVIEDSIRGHPGPRPSELEGLACPRTKSPPPQVPPPSQPNKLPPGPPPAGYRLNGGGNGGEDFHEYPAMEGLGARFGSYLAKRTSTESESFAGKPHHHGGGSWGDQHPHPNSSYRYPAAGHYQQQQQYNSMPPRKRASPSSSMPVLPPKKQHVDSGVDYSFPKDEESGRKWQDEINSGFDRLVAYATEVDKRRKSTDSSNNSPVRPNSGLSHEDSKDAAIVDDVFESASTSSSQQQRNYLSMKFKPTNFSSGTQARGVVSANSPYARTMPVHNSSKSHVPSALASIASLDDLQTTASVGPVKSPLPGENLPEHHFKKRYFAEHKNPSSRNGSPPPLSSSPAT